MLEEVWSSTTSVRARIAGMLGLSAGEGSELGSIAPSALLRYTRRTLLEAARLLGLTGIHRLTKEALVERFHEALQALAPAATAPPRETPPKFDLGRAPEAAVEQANIPWGYGQDRVTAMVVDPERLFVYWEVTDEAIARARPELGAGGATAALSLRVYDVSGRIFDGTNAHDYFDHAIARGDRQWFFSIGKPSSTAVVELGLKSDEGYFVRIARSGRADFPRREPVGPGGVEWLTVRTAVGAVDEPRAGAPAATSPVACGATIESDPVRAWDIRGAYADGNGQWTVRGWGRAHEWSGGRSVEWEGPVVRTSWEAGPFTYAVDAPGHVEERVQGTVTTTVVDGRTHVVHGPWRVVIRGLGARAERRVLAVWEIRRSWVTHGETIRSVAGRTSWASGGSEQRVGGASERRWLAASELRLGGASEVYLLGASELRYLGASETAFAAASEWRHLGASEWRYAGASERVAGGASEQRHAGASERHLGYPERQGAPASPKPGAG
jgi:hypothetical protein